MRKIDLNKLLEEASVNNACQHQWKSVFTREGVGIMCTSGCGVLLCDGIDNKDIADSITQTANNLCTRS